MLIMVFVSTNIYRFGRLIAHALAEIGPTDKAVVEALTQALDDEDLMVARAAARALNKLGHGK